MYISSDIRLTAELNHGERLLVSMSRRQDRRISFITMKEDIENHTPVLLYLSYFDLLVFTTYICLVIWI